MKIWKTIVAAFHFSFLNCLCMSLSKPTLLSLIIYNLKVFHNQDFIDKLGDFKILFWVKINLKNGHRYKKICGIVSCLINHNFEDWLNLKCNEVQLLVGRYVKPWFLVWWKEKSWNPNFSFFDFSVVCNDSNC